MKFKALIISSVFSMTLTVSPGSLLASTSSNLCDSTCSDSKDTVKELAIDIKLNVLLQRLDNLINQTFTIENIYSAFDYDSLRMVRNGSFFSLRFIEEISEKEGLFDLQNKARDLLSMLNQKTSRLSEPDIPQKNMSRFIKCFSLSKFDKVLKKTKKNSDNQIFFDLFKALDTENILFISHIKDFKYLLNLNTETVAIGLKVGSLSIEITKGMSYQICPMSCSDYISNILKYNIKDSNKQYEEIISIIKDLTIFLDSYFKQ